MAAQMSVWSRLWRSRGIFAGVLVFAAVILVALHRSELDRFAALAERAAPLWLLVAFVGQVGTYAFSALAWVLLSAGRGHRLRFFPLVPLGLARVFADQALPSGGLSGTLLIFHGFLRRGVPPATAASVLLGAVVTFYAAFITAVVLSVAIFWMRRVPISALIGLTGAFVVVALALPAGALWLARRGDHPLPAPLARVGALRGFRDAVGRQPIQLGQPPGRLAAAWAAQFAVFLCDGITVWAAFAAVGAPVAPDVAFAGLCVAMMTALITPLPLGLGSFEAGAIIALRGLGVGYEPALAATLLTRGFSFWLPMLPSLWLVRAEMRKIE